MSTPPGDLVDNPVARSASGTKALTIVDLPTPLCPMRTVRWPARDCPEFGQISPASAADRGDIQIPVGIQEVLRVGQIGLRHEQQRSQAGVVGGHQAAVHETLPGFRICGGNDDAQLVGIGDQRSFGAVVVVRCTEKQGGTRLLGHDAGEGTVVAGDIARQLHPIPDHDSAAPQLRAFTAISRVPSEISQVNRPRSTAVTTPGTALRWDGRTLERGRVLRPGLTRTSSSSSSRATRRPPAGPQVREVRQRLGRGGDIGHCDARDDEPQDGPERRHPVIVIGAHLTGANSSGVGEMANPSGSSTAVIPSRPNSVTTAFSRSVSWPRRWPTPVIWEGPEATAQTAATVGTSSPTSDMSIVIPRGRSGPPTSGPTR